MAGIASHAPKALYGGRRQASLGLCIGAKAALISDEVLIVTNQDYYYLTELASGDCCAPRVSYMLEPKGRNTAPAIAGCSAYPKVAW